MQISFLWIYLLDLILIHNAAIDEFCKAYMTKLLDVNSLYTNAEFVTNSGLTNDGLHPQEKAYRKLTDFILTGVNSKDE